MGRALLLAAAVTAPAAFAAPPAFGPFGSPRHPVTREVRAATPTPRGGQADTFFRLAFDFYRTVVTPINGPTCSHRPTCSLYGLQAVRRHGVVGMWLTIDRLWRGHASSVWRELPHVTTAGRVTLIDPLEESTFWFSPSPR